MKEIQPLIQTSWFRVLRVQSKFKKLSVFIYHIQTDKKDVTWLARVAVGQSAEGRIGRAEGDGGRRATIHGLFKGLKQHCHLECRKDLNISGQISKVSTWERNKKEQCLPLPEIFSSFASEISCLKPKKPSYYPLLLHSNHNSVVKLTFWSSPGGEARPAGNGTRGGQHSGFASSIHYYAEPAIIQITSLIS